MRQCTDDDGSFPEGGPGWALRLANIFYECYYKCRYITSYPSFQFKEWEDECRGSCATLWLESRASRCGTCDGGRPGTWTRSPDGIADHPTGSAPKGRSRSVTNLSADSPRAFRERWRLPAKWSLSAIAGNPKASISFLGNGSDWDQVRTDTMRPDDCVHRFPIVVPDRERDHWIMLERVASDRESSIAFDLYKPGAMTFFRAPPREHTPIAKHLTAEESTGEDVAGTGLLTRWEHRRRNNHSLDALYNACAAGRFCGARLLGAEPVFRRRPARSVPTRPMRCPGDRPFIDLDEWQERFGCARWRVGMFAVD